MRFIIAVAALLAASPATAGTLVLFDVTASYGDRLALTPLLEQEFARLSQAGLARPMMVPVNEDGTERTTVLDVWSPVQIPPLGSGIRVQQGRVTWQVTTAMVDGTLSYQAVVTRQSAYNDGVTLTQPTAIQTEISGTGSAMRPGPIIARRYDAPGGPRMVIGFLRP